MGMSWTGKCHFSIAPTSAVYNYKDWCSNGMFYRRVAYDTIYQENETL